MAEVFLLFADGPTVDYSIRFSLKSLSLSQHQFSLFSSIPSFLCPFNEAAEVSQQSKVSGSTGREGGGGGGAA